jgi:two-component system NtrC family response regulator
LIIDDDKDLCSILEKMLELEGHKASSFHTLHEGLAVAQEYDWDLIFLDVMMPDGIGLDILPDLRNVEYRPEVIIMTSAATADGAEMALMNGAWDYIQKPFSFSDLKLTLTRVLQYRREKTGKPTRCILKLNEIVWCGPDMDRSIDLLSQAAFCDVNVLITGETGTGKELFARAIHENSKRANQSFVVVDCAALPEHLVESTLFGHEKGSFTGADRAYDGLVSQANGGTLFMDEVGEMPVSLQKTFLRVLQERRFRRIGGSKEITSDFRLIAATNRNLEKMSAEKTFRPDLFFRIRSLQIDLPPLRGRSSDIKEIAFHYLKRFSENYGTGIKGFSPEFLEALYAYDWPGNVRELVHALERAYAVAGNEPTFFPVHLPNHIRIALARSRIEKKPSEAHSELMADEPLPEILPSIREVIERKERQYLETLLLRTDGDLNEACRISGLSRSSFYEKLKRHCISPRQL